MYLFVIFTRIKMSLYALSFRKISQTLFLNIKNVIIFDQISALCFDENRSYKKVCILFSSLFSDNLI